MSLPGPGFAVLSLGLLAFAATLAVVGEAVRSFAASRVPLFGELHSVERLVLDFYVGLGVLYAASALPPGGFYPATLPVLAAGALALLAVRVRRHARPALAALWARCTGAVRDLRTAWPVLTLAAGLGLFLVEAGAAQGQPTGNTFDSSLYTTYIALLNAHHGIPLSFSPIAPYSIAYPQATTVAFAAAQGFLGLPAARTSLLVTPLFMGVAPLGAYAFGRRTFSSAPMGAAFALTLALLGEWTRTLVAGSNDFVAAFPLVLVLWGWIPGVWGRAAPPALGSALGFGAVLGLSAAFNPVGAEATVLAVALLFGARAPAGWSAVRRGIPRFAAAVATACVPVLPSLTVLAEGGGLAGSSTISAQSIPIGLTGAGWVGHLDPFLFRPGNDNLSSFPILRAELALLLVGGVLLLLVLGGPSRSALERPGFGLTSLAIGGAIALLLTFEALPFLGLGALATATRLSSADELSWLLFALYTCIASVPLGLLLHRATQAPSAPPVPPVPPGPFPHPRLLRPRAARRWWDGALPPPVALGVALLLLVPGVAVTAYALPEGIAPVYQHLGNVSAGDFGLLAWSAGHLPDGARVLVAPGSAAEFLPGYQPDVVLLYPMVVFGTAANGSYTLVVSQLTNATLDPAGENALAVLAVGYIAVTGANTVLWPPFAPAPLLTSPRATLLFHEGDAYLFAWSAA